MSVFLDSHICVKMDKLYACSDYLLRMTASKLRWPAGETLRGRIGGGGSVNAVEDLFLLAARVLDAVAAIAAVTTPACTCRCSSDIIGIRLSADAAVVVEVPDSICVSS